MRLSVLSFLNFHAESNIGKTPEQIICCVQFILAKGNECHGLIKAKQKIQLLETVDNKGRYHFKFFKPFKENPEVSQKQDACVKHCLN